MALPTLLYPPISEEAATVPIQTKDLELPSIRQSSERLRDRANIFGGYASCVLPFRREGSLKPPSDALVAKLDADTDASGCTDESELRCSAGREVASTPQTGDGNEQQWCNCDLQQHRYKWSEQCRLLQGDGHLQPSVAAGAQCTVSVTFTPSAPCNSE